MADSFTDALLKKGYIQDEKGNFKRPAEFKKPVQAPSEVIMKAKVVESSSFDHKPVTEWFIPYQVPSKKNSRQVFVSKNGKMVNIPSKAYLTYVAATKMYWEVFGKEFRKTIETLQLKFPLNIEMTFTRKTNQIVDFFGPGESAFDLMTDFGWWPDDSIRYAKPFFGDMNVDKDNPGVKIKILL